MLVLAACSSAPVQERPAPPSKPAAPAVKPPDKGDPQARFDAALTQLKGGDRGGAEQAFLSLTQDFPQFPGPWVNLGIIYAKSNRVAPAIDALGHATQLDPNNVIAWNWLGILNRQAGYYDRAKLAYERGLQAAPDDAMTHRNYAILLDAYLKQPQAAIEQYKQYQSLTPKEDLAVTAWVAALEAQVGPTTPPAAAATPANAPTAPAPTSQQTP
ncbi:tetratricopeptide repeat protein [Solimonas sp. C16B3]|uniref:Tetratricopeptide repeat protein n=1 Tax=Solimonas marina TaxID=2714601 RepID=A0A969WFH1_9GAMM|nr:tetratricopeptide repeat protein [Solimonas marina]